MYYARWKSENDAQLRAFLLGDLELESLPEHWEHDHDGNVWVYFREPFLTSEQAGALLVEFGEDVFVERNFSADQGA